MHISAKAAINEKWRGCFYSVRNNSIGFDRMACHTLIPEVMPAITNNTSTEFTNVDTPMPEFTAKIIFNKSLVSAYPP